MNLIQNPNFETGIAGWQFYASGGGAAIADDGAAAITIDAPGDNIQFFQRGLSLKPATRYRLSFTAGSNDLSGMSVYVHRHDAPYDDYGLRGWMVELSAVMMRYEVFFTTPAGDLPNGRLRFWFAPFARSGTVYRIGDVELAEAAEQPTEPEPEPEPEPPPVDLSRQLSVIVRDIPPGGWHEVRHVRPRDLVVVNGEIDWDATRYTGYILADEDDGTADD